MDFFFYFKKRAHGPKAKINGIPSEPHCSNLFMRLFEDTAQDTFPSEISLWKRYVDDTVVGLMDALLEDFTNHINSIHPAIKFTREEETEKSLAVLDAKITRDDLGQLSFSVYRKPHTHGPVLAIHQPTITT